MFNDRFGSFSYQIKPTKFYQFLELSHSPVGGKNPHHLAPQNPTQTQQFKPKQKESQNHSR